MKCMVFLALFLFQNVIVYPQHNASAQLNPDSVLLSVQVKLNSLKTIRYENIRELNYSSENYLHTSNWAVYYDFQTPDTIAGFKYQIDDSTSKQVFNGTEKFELDKKEKTIRVNDGPDKKAINNTSALYNSIITVKNVLPLLIGDKTALKSITDTIVNNNLYNLVTVNIGKRRIQNLGTGFDTMKTKSNFIYKIIIEKNSYLPVEVIQENDINKDFIKTNFRNIQTDANAPSEISWYYSSYTNEFKPAAAIAVPELLPRGSLSPEWKLEFYNGKKMIALSELKGKVVLLDFWIKNCNPCIESVPYLNRLQDKFRDKDVKIISINSYDSKEEVNWFCTKHKTNYTVLLNGKTVAEKYGVSSFPAFFVLDKTGKIIYSNSGYNASVHSAIEQAIKKAL